MRRRTAIALVATSALLPAAPAAVGQGPPANGPGSGDRATCAGRAPGPEPGKTILQICAPQLLTALERNGLVPIEEAPRLQPVPVDRIPSSSATGEPVVLQMLGGVARLDGIKLSNRARTTMRVRIDVVVWPPGRQTFLRGHRTLDLRAGTRLRVRGARTVELVSRKGTGRLRLRETRVVEDP